ncbi:MAG: hypothetical protein ABIR70_18755 [Bryobacteraceae bacterium]
MKTVFLFAFLTGVLSAQVAPTAPTPTIMDPMEKRIMIEERIEGTAVPGMAARRMVFATGPQTMEFVSGMSIGPTVTKAPYSAEAVTETIQTLYDGNRVVQRSSSKQFRDSEGRERREEAAPLDVIFITDPVAKVSYTLHPDRKTADKMALDIDPGNRLTITSARTTPFVRASGPVGTGAGAGPGGGIGLATQGGVTSVVNIVARAPSANTAKEEDLGTRMIEGDEAKGSRTVTTIPAGEIGNDRAIEIVDERWYSPYLQLTVLTRHADPRSGENVYKLVNIQRIEQVRSLFEVPAGYSVIQESMGNRGFVKEE